MRRIFSVLPPDPAGSETRSDAASPLSLVVYLSTFPSTDGVNVTFPVVDPAVLWLRDTRKLTSTVDPARGAGLICPPAITGGGVVAVFVVVLCVPVAGGAFVLLKFPELKPMRGKVVGETSQSEV